MILCEMDSADGINAEAPEPTKETTEVAVTSSHTDMQTQHLEQSAKVDIHDPHENHIEPEHEVNDQGMIDPARHAEELLSAEESSSISLLARYKELLMDIVKEQSDLTFSKSLKLLEGIDQNELNERKAELKGVFNDVLESMIAPPQSEDQDIESDDSGSSCFAIIALII